MRVRRKTHNIDDLGKRLMQTWLDFKQDVIDSVLMAGTLNTCSEMCDHLYDSSEHSMKLSV